MDSEPAVVTEYPSEEAIKRLESLENQELDSSRGQLNADSYTEFLGLYLLTRDLVNAKMLWKRIPTDVKTSNTELKAVWEVGKVAWKHDYSGIHAMINAYEWGDTLKRIMLQYKRNMQEHCLNLVAGAYTSIKLAYLANILGLNGTETIETVKGMGWTLVEETQIIKPIKTKLEMKYTLNNEEHLERLTQHILFLET